MWLIEFTEGYLNGLTLPIEPRLLLTGEQEVTDNNTLSVPEYLSGNVNLVIKLEEKGLYLNGWKKRTIKLKENVIYSISGLRFFVFSQGNRNPKLKRFYFMRYGTLGLMTFLLSLFVLIVVLFLIQHQQEKNIGEYFNKVGSGYIKDGKLYVFDQKIKQQLPDGWQNQTKVIQSDNYPAAAHLNVGVVSNSSGKPLSYQLIDKENYTQIRVDFPEKEMLIMQLFGEYGITFVRKDDVWLVNDLAKASQLLKSKGYNSELSQLKSNYDDSQIIDAQDFPYSVFFSTQGGGYIYDQQVRYWEGSNVPGFGVIDSISEEKIIFKKDNKSKIYFIHR
ncbi:hypothetical protein [Photorhabdus heterorhabditis]|uniref:Uncharacterized protein n=1 Tax=Photorhabdus heterorhabditis TaxID=880156 RepID=A0A5B0XBL7_9GAMM|nr:hypothetical protein [Photorhabdus heterorhabditis]KAA1195499.1 hypothetical protein F0L16_02105 [Photorhabdus heterorhabditis]MBS9441038.1 hypothetical protein [Photorhabdus heterorhabditis]